MMDIAAIDRAVKATELPLDRLATSTQVPEKDKIAEVTRQFEAVLLRQILSQANKPLFSSSLLGGGGTSGAIYQDLITEQLAERISQGGTFGFAKVLQTQMNFSETKAANAPSADSKAL